MLFITGHAIMDRTALSGRMGKRNIGGWGNICHSPIHDIAFHASKQTLQFKPGKINANDVTPRISDSNEIPYILVEE